MSDLVKIPITPERAAEAVQRLINSHFGNANGARCRIPADPENDDDLIASRFVVEAQERIAQQDGALRDLRLLLSAASHCLRSYQYGNASTELAEGMADRIDQQLQPKGEQG